MVKYFLDTYALIEITKENRAYLKYANEEVFTSVLNLYELYYIILRDYNENIAKENFLKFKRILISFNDKQIFDASRFKLKNKKNNISCTDAIGYTIALSNDMIFVTGDKEFKGLPQVEFVK